MMKSDFVVVGRFEAIVGVREEKISPDFWWIFRNVRESENVGEFLRGLSLEEIENKLMSKYGKEVILRELDITKHLELACFESNQTKYFQDLAGIGRDLPEILEDYISRGGR